jgi:hypothetical protein
MLPGATRSKMLRRYKQKCMKLQPMRNMSMAIFKCVKDGPSDCLDRLHHPHCWLVSRVLSANVHIPFTPLPTSRHMRA